MEIDDVRAFVAVAEAGSVSRAAGELNLSQPAVTRRLQRLEVALAASLLDRRKRPFEVTPAGRAALATCRRLLASVRELKAVAGDGNGAAAELRIGVAHALTELALSEPVEDLQRAFPRVALRLRTGWSRELLERVRTGTLEAAVILLPEGERPPADVRGERLADDRLLIVAAREGTRAAIRSIRDLADAGWVLNPQGCNGRASLERALLRHGVALRVEVEAYSYDLQLELVARDRGLGLVPARIWERSRLGSRLSTLRVPGLSFGFGIWSVAGQPADSAVAVVDALNGSLRRRLTRSGNGRSRRARRGNRVPAERMLRSRAIP
jgi:DNA-binding transcriptional LysR family regulator